MAILPHKQILSLHAAVVSAHLTSSRATLLGGIEPTFAESLPICTNQSSQILSDLHGLNAAEQFDNGVVPLRIWLENALALLGQRAEAGVFRSALVAAEAPEAITNPASPSWTPHASNEIAAELSRIARAVLLAHGRELTRSLYEVEALLARCPHHIEARLLRDQINRAVEKDALYQTRVAGGLTEAGGRVPIAMQNRLRVPPGSFTGRERELRELMRQIGPGGVLICGLGGMGKTALALKLVQALAPSYPDLQIIFDLKGTRQDPLSPATAMAEIVRAFLPAAPLPERPEEIASLYHAVLNGQRALFLLEDARDAAQIEPLLPPAGSVLLVTSRRRFALPGVHVLSLDRLDGTDARALLQRLAPRVDSENAGKLADLCEGLPLVLRLAGCALSQRLDLTPEGYADRLRDAQARYDHVDAALSVSLALLDPILQILWSRLGLVTSYFSGGDAATITRWHITNDEVLSDLVAYGMIEHDPATKLYSLHRAGRRLAMSRLTEADRAKTEPRLKYLSNRSRGDLWNLDLGMRELEVALSAARRTGQRRVEVFYLKSLVDTYLRQVYGIAKDPKFADLGICRKIGDRSYENHVWGKVWGERIQRNEHLEDDRRVIEFGEQALVIFLECGDRREESHMLGKLCLLYENLEDDRRAIELGEQGLSIFREIGDWYGEGQVLETLGRLYERINDDRRAVEVYERSLDILREQADRLDTFDLERRSRQIALVYQRLGELDKATTALDTCIEEIERNIGRYDWAENHEAAIDRLRALLTK